MIEARQACPKPWPKLISSSWTIITITPWFRHLWFWECGQKHGSKKTRLRSQVVSLITVYQGIMRWLKDDSEVIYLAMLGSLVCFVPLLCSIESRLKEKAGNDSKCGMEMGFLQLLLSRTSSYGFSESSSIPSYSDFKGFACCSCECCHIQPYPCHGVDVCQPLPLQ